MCICCTFIVLESVVCTGLFSPFPSLGSLSLWTQLGAGMAGQEAARPAGCH